MHLPNLQMKSTDSFAMLQRIILVLVLLFLARANGREKCQEDAECSLDTFCSNGFCEGDCVKCQLFRREESANGCVKEIKNCGPCLSGTEAEVLVGGGKSIYCKPSIGHFSTPAIETSANSSLPWELAAVIVFLIAAVVIVGAILRHRRGTFTIGTGWIRDRIRGTFAMDLILLHIFILCKYICFSCLTFDIRRRNSTPNEEVGLGRTGIDNPPPFNPNFDLTTGFPEAINHVVPDHLSDGESDDSTDPSSASNRLLPPGEIVNSNANLGIYEGVKIDLSEFRRSESLSINIEGSPGAQFSPVNIDSDNEDEDNVSFAIVVTKTN